MTVPEIVGIILLTTILILLIWNIYEFNHTKKSNTPNPEIHELRARFNFLIAVGSLFVFILAYLGFNVKEEIIKRSDPMIHAIIDSVKHDIDSLLDNKNILKAGIYIVSDIIYKKDSIYRFDQLRTIDNKKLPIFTFAPKLIINTNTGEDLRIREINAEFFILAEPVSEYGYIIFGDNPNYKKIKPKFDVWIADYKTD